MSPALQEILNRIASATSAIRTRIEDTERLERHGTAIPNGQRELAARLEKVAANLEGALR